MYLSALTKSVPGCEFEGPDLDIRGLSADSRSVGPDMLFAALPGVKADGRQFMADALKQGAVAILIDETMSVPDEMAVALRSGRLAVMRHADPRQALARLAGAFYGMQPRRIAAVTGTNGKTSTAFFTQYLWQALGEKSASLGTVGVYGPGIERPGTLTTPDPVALHAELAELAGAGITHLAMEASSHGIEQRRLDGVKIQVAGFTNLTRDHLDYHGDMEEYFQAKRRLFTDLVERGGAAALNADVPEYVTLAADAAGRDLRFMSYGRAADADLKLVHAEPAPHGQRLTLKIGGKLYNAAIPLIGSFMAMNLLCALGMVLAEHDADPHVTEKLIHALPELRGAPGRLQPVPGHPAGASVYVDYAHTADALENVLRAVRAHATGRVVCVFGCGGDRDRGKRPLMGDAVRRLADIGIVTDDNPRTEDPAAIRAAVLEAFPDALEIGDRRSAIRHAVGLLRAGDVLVIAGKGHERGQKIGDRVEPFDDVDEARAALADLGASGI